MQIDDWRLVQARWQLRLLYPERLPALAAAALEAGVDSPSLRVLAGEREPTRETADPLLAQVLRELGLPPTTDAEAARVVARSHAAQIVDETLSPYEGAKAIWDECCDLEAPGSALDAFKSLASEHEDYRFAGSEGPRAYDEEIRETEEAIVREARAVLGLADSRVGGADGRPEPAATSAEEAGAPDEATSRWSLWRITSGTAIVAGVFVVVQVAVLLLVLATELARDPALDVEQWAAGVESNGFFLSLATLATALSCVPLVRLIVGRVEADAWRFLGLTRASARDVALWCLALGAFVALSDAITVAIGRPVVPEFMAEVFATANPVLLFFALVLAAPLFEEVFFRGFLLAALDARGLSVGVAAVVSSLCWASIHTQYDAYGIGTIFAIGLLLAAARVKTGSLVPCLAMHALANVIALTETAFASGRPA